jgi:hypothetical protein
MKSSVNGVNAPLRLYPYAPAGLLATHVVLYTRAVASSLVFLSNGSTAIRSELEGRSEPDQILREGVNQHHDTGQLQAFFEGRNRYVAEIVWTKPFEVVATHELETDRPPNVEKPGPKQSPSKERWLRSEEARVEKQED